MEDKNFNLNGTITIYYNNKVLLDEVQYRLLNLVLTDGSLANALQELNLSRSKAMGLINRMNRLAPETVVDMGKKKDKTYLQVSDFGMKLLNSYAQKEFELYIFLKDGNRHLNASFHQNSRTARRIESISA
ncbi:winged helix-turn-helix domain-containing protein [Alkalitalea saponilacus]|uniref:ModE molybdate transport repressor domain-containing protein n=1 Tax=Alkalitalea saponilacus TaxID=889453 RepID=A0A1T5GQV6_9BACT|nr:hypothetical protein [Alkalitalea saponilacus]ASB48221.1 hypothetical protein CDL62_03230 [Alkalitalea saponilacus]SKC10749.1 ModE molybdate transport repressor domain-containing protein [Alkalitalea saponilacus]